MMTRKHYQLIADAIAASYDHPDTTPEGRTVSVVMELSRRLKQDNPRFDPERFISAAIPDQLVRNAVDKY